MNISYSCRPDSCAVSFFTTNIECRVASKKDTQSVSADDSNFPFPASGEPASWIQPPVIQLWTDAIMAAIVLVWETFVKPEGLM
jgi:hypothetical protein